MIIDDKKYIVVGKIGAPHGVQGWVKIRSHTIPSSNIMDYKTWYTNTKTGWEIINIENCQRHGKTVIAHIKGVNDPESARQYVGKNIAVLRSQLPKPKKDEYYWTDLEGMEVINNQGEKLGVMDHMIETGANDIMVVIGDRKRLIPFLHKRIVLNIDFDKNIIFVDWDKEF